MKHSRTNKLLAFILACTLPLGTVNADTPLSLADGPLAINTGVDPNVMLLMDNSGSMDNIIWDVDRTLKQPDGTEISRATKWPTAPTPYVPGTTYTDWCKTPSTTDTDCSFGRKWTRNDGNYYLYYINYYAGGGAGSQEGTKCSEGWVEGFNGTDYKCLKLPDPADADWSFKWITRYNGQYLNYLFSTYPDGADLTDTATYPWIPQTSRMQEARKGASELVSAITGVRFGAASFGSGDQGAQIDASCGSSTATVTSKINALLATHNTPLAESYYELTRYFRGMSSFYHGTSYTSPIQYRCQQNFAVVITDGLPTLDTSFPAPGSDPDIQSGCDSSDGDPDTTPPCLPNWDELATATTYATYPVFPQYSDGVTPIPTYGTYEGATLFLDDLAKFGYDIDLRKDPATPGTSPLSNNDLAGESFDDPANEIQNLKTFTIGFTLDNQMLQDAAFYGQDYLRDNLGNYILDGSGNKQKIPAYYTASEGEKLKDSLLKILQTIKSTSGSAAAVASSTGFISEETLLFQAQYDTSFWEGRLLAYQLDTEGHLQYEGGVPKAEWDASAILTNSQTYDSRVIFTYNDTASVQAGVPFRWGDISTTMQGLLGSSDILNYLRGDPSNETLKPDSAGTPNPSGTLRPRGFITKDTDGNVTGFKRNVLGDIVNSAPVHVGKPSFPYPDVWAGTSAPENCSGCEYSKFRDTYSYDAKPTPTDVTPKYNRGDYPIVYVGANDGMLHGFKAVNYIPGTTTPDPERGYEKLAYVPRVLYNNLAKFSDPAYSHSFYVDGSPTVVDAFYKARDGSTGWHTTLAGGLNKGGQGIYVLDITDPKAFAESAGKAKEIVQWEFSDADDADLGYTYSQPLIARMANDKWAVIFGNGYNNTEADGNASTTGNAVLYIAFIEDGVDGKWNVGDFIKIDTEAGLDDDPKNPTAGTGSYDPSKSQPNGLATVSAIDINEDYITDYIYAGDLYGNLWKFDVSNSNTAKWTIYNKSGSTPVPFFIAQDSSGIRQPITTRPEVIRASNGNIMVLLGTGKYIETTDTDTSTATTQSFYGIIDTADTKTHAGRSAMLKQEIIDESTRTFTNPDTGTPYDQLVRETSDYGADKFVDWYMDMQYGTQKGERVVSAPVVRGFLRPHIIFVSIIPGVDPCVAGGVSWLMELDARDGSKTDYSVFDLNYDGNINTADNDGPTVLNGWREAGIQTAPSIIAAGETERKFLSSSTGGIREVTEASPAASAGRQSWQQLK